jgi:hypothetical protein
MIIIIFYIYVFSFIKNKFYKCAIDILIKIYKFDKDINLKIQCKY